MDPNTLLKLAELVLAGTSEVLDAREIWRELTEYRTRQWVMFLQNASAQKQVRGELAVSRLVQSTHGRRVLQHVVRDCLTGTEVVSLAALAIIASDVSTDGPTAFSARAARAVDNLADADAAAFLSILSRPAATAPLSGSLGATVSLDCASIQQDSWSPLRITVGLDEEGLYAAVRELTTRRLFLPDTANGRLASVRPVVDVTFTLTEVTLHYYQLLHRALAIADPDLFAALELLPVDAARETWTSRLESDAVRRRGTD